jgi:hypothetical protein
VGEIGDSVEVQLVGCGGSHGRFVLRVGIRYTGVGRSGIINPVGFDNRGGVTEYAEAVECRVFCRPGRCQRSRRC